MKSGVLSILLLMFSVFPAFGQTVDEFSKIDDDIVSGRMFTGDRAYLQRVFLSPTYERHLFQIRKNLPIMRLIDNNKTSALTFLFSLKYPDFYWEESFDDGPGFESSGPKISIVGYAIKTENREMVNFLLKSGIKITQDGDADELLLGIENDNVDIFNILVEHGAKIDKKYYWTAPGAPQSSEWRLIHYAIGHNGILSYMLKTLKVDPNSLSIYERKGGRNNSEFEISTLLPCSDPESSALITAAGGLEFFEYVKTLSNSDFRQLVPYRNSFSKSSNVNVRSDPTRGDNMVGQLSESEPVFVVGTGRSETIDGVRGRWCLIRTTKNLVGWTFGAFLYGYEMSDVEDK